MAVAVSTKEPKPTSTSGTLLPSEFNRPLLHFVLYLAREERPLFELPNCLTKQATETYSRNGFAQRRLQVKINATYTPQHRNHINLHQFNTHTHTIPHLELLNNNYNDNNLLTPFDQMRPPRTRRARSVNPSRFQEGSMNDRVSNAPPVAFLGPDEVEELERPVTRSQSKSRPVSDDWADKQVKKGRLGHVWEEVRGRLGFRKDEDDSGRGSRKRDRSRKGDRGEDGGGRRERSRLRSLSRGRDRSRSRGRERDSSVKREQKRDKEDKARDERLREEAAPKTDMPSREEILANYHSLVANGFFTSHAIQSTRQPPPGAAGGGPATPSAKMTPQPQANNLSASRVPHRSTTPQPHLAATHRSTTPQPHLATTHRSTTPQPHLATVHRSTTPQPHIAATHRSTTPQPHLAATHRSTTPQPHIATLHRSTTPQPPPGVTLNRSATLSVKATPKPQANRLGASRATQRSNSPQPPPVAMHNRSATPSARETPKTRSNNLSALRVPGRSTTPQPPPPRAPTPSARPRSSGGKTPSSPKKQQGWEPQAATYEELVAGGFFSPPVHPLLQKDLPESMIHPLLRKAPASPAAAAPAPVVYSTRSTRDYLQLPANQWNFRTGSPSPSRKASPVPTPGSVSSRGTKRNAVEIPTDDEDEDNHVYDPPTPNKKLRKTVSRDNGALKPSEHTPRRAMAPRRSISVSGINNSGRESNNLARRVLGRLPGANARNNASTPDHHQQTVSRSASGSAKHPSESHYSRVLRSRRSAKDALRSAQNANRTPQVPGISHKFVSCEDRENGAPYLTLHF